jgi:DNA-binding IclR family transcriptional regulator
LNVAKPRAGRIQAVERALSIMERVARAAEGLALRDLAAALGLGATTVHNLAATLVARGYLAKTAAPKRYVLGAAARALAAAGGQQALEQQVAAAVRVLAHHWPQATITVAQPVEHEIVTSLRSSPEQRGALQRPAHQLLPPYTSASALVFEAFWNAVDRTAYQQQFPFAEYGRGYWGPGTRHERFLAQIRRRGCAVLDLKDGRLRAAVPVCDAAQVIRFALGVSLPMPKPSVQARLVRELQRAAQAQEEKEQAHADL